MAQPPGAGLVDAEALLAELANTPLNQLENRLDQIPPNAFCIFSSEVMQEMETYVRYMSGNQRNAFDSGGYKIYLWAGLGMRLINDLTSSPVDSHTETRAGTAISPWTLEFIELCEWHMASFREEIFDKVISTGVTSLDDRSLLVGRSNFKMPRSLNIQSKEPTIRRNFDKFCCTPIESICEDKSVFGMSDVNSDVERTNGVGSRSDVTIFFGEIAYLVIEAKKPLDVVTIFQSPNLFSRAATASMSNRNDLSAPALAGLQQLFSYMVTRGLRFGVYTTHEFTYLLKRDNKGTLFITPPISGFARGESRPDDETITTNRALFALLFCLKHGLVEDAIEYFPSDDSEDIDEANFFIHCAYSYGDKLDSEDSDNVNASAGQAAREFFEKIRDYYKHASLEFPKDLEIKRRRFLDLLPLDENHFSMPLPWKSTFQFVRAGNLADTARITTNAIGGVRDVYVKTFVIHTTHDVDEINRQLQHFLKEIDFYNGPLRALQGIAVPFLVYGGHFHQRPMIATTSSGIHPTSLMLDRHPWIIDRAVESLQLIHAAGVLHGDIADRNIAFDADAGMVHFIDFGEAKTVPGTDSLAVVEKEKELATLMEVFEMIGSTHLNS